MHIHVGPFRYEVRLVHGYIRHEGTECLGLCDNIAQRILISDVPGESQRLQVFFHELMHAWWYHFGVDAADEEAVVDLVGVAMTDFLLQAVRQFRASLAEPVSGDSLSGPGSGAFGDSGGAGESGGEEGGRANGRPTSTKRRPAVRATPAAYQLRGMIERMLPVLCVESGRQLDDVEPAAIDRGIDVNAVANERETGSDDRLTPTGVATDAEWVISIYDRTSVGACRPRSRKQARPRREIRPQNPHRSGVSMPLRSASA